MSGHANVVITYTFLFAYVAKNENKRFMAAITIHPTRLESPTRVIRVF